MLSPLARSTPHPLRYPAQMRSVGYVVCDEVDGGLCTDVGFVSDAAPPTRDAIRGACTTHRGVHEARAHIQHLRRVMANTHAGEAHLGPALPSLKIIHTVKLGGDTIAHRGLLATLEKHHHLVVTLGNSYFLTSSLNVNAIASSVDRMLSTSDNVVESTTGGLDAVGCDVVGDGDGDGDSNGDGNGDDDGKGGEEVAEESGKDGTGCEMVSERGKLNVGTKPADLRFIKSKGSDHIFTACDRPTVVYSATDWYKLLVSTVNLQEVTRVCGFDTSAFPDCLAIATDTGLHLGAVDESQKIHITSVPLDEQPRRIAHLDSNRLFAVTTERPVLDERGDEMIEHYIRIVDETRYDTLNRYRLNLIEIGSSVLTKTFSGENMDMDEQFLVVGTALELPKEENPKCGRVLISRISSSGCILGVEHQTHAAVYSMLAHNGMLIAGIEPEVRVLSVCERKDVREGTTWTNDKDANTAQQIDHEECVKGADGKTNANMSRYGTTNPPATNLGKHEMRRQPSRAKMKNLEHKYGCIDIMTDACDKFRSENLAHNPGGAGITPGVHVQCHSADLKESNHNSWDDDITPAANAPSRKADLKQVSNTNDHCDMYGKTDYGHNVVIDNGHQLSSAATIRNGDNKQDDKGDTTPKGPEHDKHELQLPVSADRDCIYTGKKGITPFAGLLQHITDNDDGSGPTDDRRQSEIASLIQKSRTKLENQKINTKITTPAIRRWKMILKKLISKKLIQKITTLQPYIKPKKLITKCYKWHTSTFSNF